MTIISRIFLLVSLLSILNIAYAGSVFKRNLVFINCTGQEIYAVNDKPPYKLSLDPATSAIDGYSAPYQFTIPAQPLTQQQMTVYRNHILDGSMSILFSGGINTSMQVNETNRGSIWGGIYVAHQSPDITLLSEYTVPIDSDAKIVIALGCSKQLK